MKTIQFTVNLKKLTISFLLLTLTMFLFSCAKKIEFENSKIAPAARGSVSINKDNNNNYQISLQVSYLTEPSRLTPPMNCYIVWLETENSRAKTIGQIVGTKDLNIRFKTVSAGKPTRIFITAEKEADANYPSNMIILNMYNH